MEFVVLAHFGVDSFVGVDALDRGDDVDWETILLILFLFVVLGFSNVAFF